MRRRSYRFNRNPSGSRSSPVTAKQTLVVKKKKCKACGGDIAPGAYGLKVRLKKPYRTPCVTCNHKRVGVKWFHTDVACAPVDIEQVMGYVAGTAPSAVPSPKTVALPPKPPSAGEAALAALASMEHALMLRAAQFPGDVTPKLEALFKTYQGIKSRALRPGTDAEGETALKLALKRAVDLIF